MYQKNTSYGKKNLIWNLGFFFKNDDKKIFNHMPFYRWPIIATAVNSLMSYL